MSPTYVKPVGDEAELTVLVSEASAVARSRKVPGSGDIHLLCKVWRQHRVDGLGDDVFAAKRRHRDADVRLRQKLGEHGRGVAQREIFWARVDAIEWLVPIFAKPAAIKEKR